MVSSPAKIQGDAQSTAIGSWAADNGLGALAQKMMSGEV